MRNEPQFRNIGNGCCSVINFNHFLNFSFLVSACCKMSSSCCTATNARKTRIASKNAWTSSKPSNPTKQESPNCSSLRKSTTSRSYGIDASRFYDPRTRRSWVSGVQPTESTSTLTALTTWFRWPYHGLPAQGATNATLSLPGWSKRLLRKSADRSGSGWPGRNQGSWWKFFKRSRRYRKGFRQLRCRFLILLGILFTVLACMMAFLTWWHIVKWWDENLVVKEQWTGKFSIFCCLVFLFFIWEPHRKRRSRGLALKKFLFLLVCGGCCSLPIPTSPFPVLLISVEITWIRFSKFLNFFRNYDWTVL